MLLSVLNRKPTGWSEFTSEAAAQGFVDQLVAAVDKYGLDGIDIDDEYSAGVSVERTSHDWFSCAMIRATRESILNAGWRSS